MPTRNGTLKYRVDQLEKGVEKLDGKMDLVLTNHLPHIQQELIAIRTRMNVLTMVNVGAIVTGIIVNKFF